MFWFISRIGCSKTDFTRNFYLYLFLSIEEKNENFQLKTRFKTKFQVQNIRKLRNDFILNAIISNKEN